MLNWIRKINKKKLIVWMAMIVFSIVLSFAVELIYFNYHSLMTKSPRVEVFFNHGVITETDVNVSADTSVPQKTKVEIKFDKPMYYKKLNIKFSNYKAQKYTVTWTGKDIYGKEKKYCIKDIKKSGYNRGVTNIEDEINAISIQYYGPYRSDIVSIKLSNSVQLNRYRLVQIFSFCFLILFLILKRRWFEDQLPAVFLVLSLILCLNYWFLEDIMQSGWDENVHFVQSYMAAMGEDAPYTKAIEEMGDMPEEIWANTYEEHRMMIGHFNRAHEKMIEENTGRSARYKDILYLPYIILIKIFSWLDCSFYQMYFLTKSGSMLCYIFIMWYTIKRAKTGKLFLVATGIMPTRLFINSTYNYDSLTTAFLTLGFVLWLNEILEPEKKITWKKALGIVLCFSLGSIVKQVYFVFILLIFFLPESKFGNRKQKKMIIGVFLMMGLIVAWAMFGSVLINYLMGVNMAGDWRGGETNIGGQISVILNAPLSYLKLMCSEIWKTAGEYLLGRFPYVNFAFHRRPENGFAYITAAAMLALFCLRIEGEKESEQILEKKSKFGVGFVLVLSLTLIWTALYVSYTPVGAEEINGVQARYYAPLIFPFMCMIKNKYMNIRTSKGKYEWIICSVIVAMNLYCLYNICCKPWTI